MRDRKRQIKDSVWLAMNDMATMNVYVKWMAKKDNQIPPFLIPEQEHKETSRPKGLTFTTLVIKNAILKDAIVCVSHPSVIRRYRTNISKYF